MGVKFPSSSWLQKHLEQQREDAEEASQRQRQHPSRFAGHQWIENTSSPRSLATASSVFTVHYALRSRPDISTASKTPSLLMLPSSHSHLLLCPETSQTWTEASQRNATAATCAWFSRCCLGLVWFSPPYSQKTRRCHSFMPKLFCGQWRPRLDGWLCLLTSTNYVKVISPYRHTNKAAISMATRWQESILKKKHQCLYRVCLNWFLHWFSLFKALFFILKTEEDNSGCYFPDRMMKITIMKNGYVRSQPHTDLETISEVFPKAAQKDWNWRWRYFILKLLIFL